jgi:hypothetical protein
VLAELANVELDPLPRRDTSPAISVDHRCEVIVRGLTIRHVDGDGFSKGRCQASFGEPAAEKPLREAWELFASMGCKLALAETEALLGEAEAAAS